MSVSDVRRWRTPREGDLGLRRIGNHAGLGISVLPNSSVFAIEHRSGSGTILVNQVLASPIDGGIGRILLRAGGASPANIEAVGSRARVRLGVAVDRVVWEGVTSGIRHRVTLRLLPDRTAWLWRVEATNAGAVAVPIDAILVQDLGLGVRVAIHRPPQRPPCALRAGRHEPPEPRSGRQAPVGNAGLSRWRERVRDRR